MFGGRMEGLIGSVVILGIFAYFYSKGSESPVKTKTTIKSTPQLPIANSYSNSSTPTTKVSGNSNPSQKQKPTSSTTGEFSRSTEGFIPTDNCECGGQWVKHVNRNTGGRFFGCSRYPACDNTRDKQQAKNFCSNGHARTSQNTAYNTDGSRRCLICRPLSKVVVRENYREPKVIRTASSARSFDSNAYCRNGHKRTSENTYVRPDGERECRICRRNAR